MTTQFILARYSARVAHAADGLLDSQDLARCTDQHPELIRRLYCLGVLEPALEWQGEPLFAPAMVRRLRRLLRLRRDLGLPWHGMGMVADLLERVDELEARVRQLEARLASTDREAF
ncbi:MAG TPA: chaperone modulator CbpM [Chthonomonadaceae bacterium]|nr:chaperone modulator CbpM [Chthonomonadaceae bacterium]